MEGGQNPAALTAHDPKWRHRARRRLADLSDALRRLDGAADATFDHIGSTSVPGLVAKPYLDLQVGILPLPSHAELVPLLAPLGYREEHGARPDSPGVTRDSPRGTEAVSDEVWEKRLYVHRAGDVILHVRRQDSPWARQTIWFRDWLRAHPEGRARYDATKRELSQANAGKADFDDYTQAKTRFFDQVQDEVLRWVHAVP